MSLLDFAWFIAAIMATVALFITKMDLNEPSLRARVKVKTKKATKQKME